MRHWEGIHPRAVAAVWWRNFRNYRRSWYLNLLPNFFEPFFYLLSMGLGVGLYITQMQGVSYAVYVAPALAVMAALNGASFEVSWNVFVRMHRERHYDAILATPVNEAEIVCGELLWAVTRATIYGLAFLLIAWPFGVIVAPHVWWLLLVLPLVGYLFAALGFVYSMAIPTMDLFSIYWTCFLTPMTLFGDTFFPLSERLPAWCLPIAEVFPILHCVRLTRGLWIGQWHATLWWDLLYLIGITLALHLAAARLFRRRLHRPAR